MTAGDTALQIGRALWSTMSFAALADTFADVTLDLFKSLGIEPDFDVRAQVRSVMAETLQTEGFIYE